MTISVSPGLRRSNSVSITSSELASSEREKVSSHEVSMIGPGAQNWQLYRMSNKSNTETSLDK